MVDTYRPGILGTTGSFGSIQWTNGVSGSTQYEIMDVSRNLANLGTVSGSGASTAGSYSTDNTVTGGSLTDGTATISSGAASGLTTIGSSGAATLDTGANGSTFGGALTVQGNLTVNGTTTQVDTDNLNVKDKNIMINASSSAASAGGAGIDVEEDGSVSGYIRVSSDRGAWEMKAPDNASVLTMDINATKTITVAGALNIEADSIINQDLTTDASVTFAGLNNSSGGITGAGSIAGATTINASGAITGGSFTDSTATLSAGALSALASLQFGAETAMVSVKDEDNMASDSATALATQQSIKAYVDSQVGDSSLSGSGDSGTFVIDLDSQVLSVIGTANEVDTFASGQQVQIGLPSDVTIGNDLTVTEDLVVNGSATLGDLSSDSLTVNASLASSLIWDTDSTYNIGSSAAKLAAVYADNVYTGDFHMKNERGDWTLFEESDHIRIRNNVSGQEFKLDMSPIK
jgi:hypothetical protein